MNLNETLECADHLVFKKTGKHLDNLQKDILKGVYQGKTYETIANEIYRSESRVRNIGGKLLQILSDSLGEDVNKSNFCWTIERVINSRFVGLVNSNVNCSVKSPQTNTSKPIQSEEKNTEKISYQDLKLAPQIIKFYDREFELKRLENWVLNQNIKLISVLGLRGIGKSYLVRKFVDLNLEKFNVIIWKNLNLTNSLAEIITDILTNINPDLKLNENKLSQFLELLKTKKCLMIFDNFQELFISGKFAGQFKPEYQDYQNLLKIITEIEHQSSLILISQEQCQEMLCLDEELYPVKCLELEGLYNNEFLQKLSLKDQESWSNLINLYEGNPVYLQDIANLIKDIYDGKVADFLAENSGTGILPDKNSGTGILPVITNNMRSQLSELFKRLSPQEKQIIEQLSKSNQPILREDLRQSLGLTSLQLIEGLRSLKRRYLLKIIEGEKTRFDLLLVVREYVKNFIQDNDN